MGHGVQHLQQFQFLGRFDRLVAELDDVHTALERGVDKLLEVALLLPGVSAQVETGSGVQNVLGHGNQSSSPKLGWYCGSRDWS